MTKNPHRALKNLEKLLKFQNRMRQDFVNQARSLKWNYFPECKKLPETRRKTKNLIGNVLKIINYSKIAIMATINLCLRFFMKDKNQRET